MLRRFASVPAGYVAGMEVLDPQAARELIASNEASSPLRTRMTTSGSDPIG
jgi:hypothetical protein